MSFIGAEGNTDENVRMIREEGEVIKESPISREGAARLIIKVNKSE